MLVKKYYDGTQVHRIISEEVKDYDMIMKILKRFADEPSEQLGTNLAEGGTDCISRQAAIDAVVFECGEWIGLAREISKQLRQLPSAQPMRKKGRWKRRLVDSGFNADWHCSECGWETAIEEHGYNYCPHCGADMRGEKANENNIQ